LNFIFHCVCPSEKTNSTEVSSGSISGPAAFACRGKEKMNLPLGDLLIDSGRAVMRDRLDKR
jgi:hypothetical protein